MTTKLAKEFDIQDFLINTENNPQAFFKACVDEDPGDGSLVNGEGQRNGSARKGDGSLKKVVVQSVPSRRLSIIRDNI